MDTVPHCEGWHNRHQKRPGVNRRSELQDSGTHPWTLSSGKNRIFTLGGNTVRSDKSGCWCVLQKTWLQPYLHSNATAPLQVIAGAEGNCGCNGRRRAGFQAVAGANKLWQGLKSVDPQLDELTLECKRAERSTGRLGSNIQSDKGI